MAEKRDEVKHAKYRENACAEAFKPLSHETYGRLGQPARKLLAWFGDVVSGPGLLSKSSFMAGAYTELSVALCKGNEVVFRMFAFNLAKLAGSRFAVGDLVPSV